MAEWIDALEAAALPVGERRVILSPYGDPIALFHLADGFFAIEDRCSHDGGELASGTCEGDQVICPRHAARFCLRDGRALSAPAYEDICSYPVRVVDGQVQIDIDV